MANFVNEVLPPSTLRIAQDVKKVGVLKKWYPDVNWDSLLLRFPLHTALAVVESQRIGSIVPGQNVITEGLNNELDRRADMDRARNLYNATFEKESLLEQHAFAAQAKSSKVGALRAKRKKLKQTGKRSKRSKKKRKRPTLSKRRKWKIAQSMCAQCQT